MNDGEKLVFETKLQGTKEMYQNLHNIMREVELGNAQITFKEATNKLLRIQSCTDELNNQDKNNKHIKRLYNAIKIMFQRIQKLKLLNLQS